MGQLDSIYTTSKVLLPWTTFLIGFVGSVHCIGMCGGLVVSCSPTPKNNGFYQLGRLSSYSLLALCAGFIGSFFKYNKDQPILSLISAIFIGSFLIWIGIKHFLTKSNSIKLPGKLINLTHRIWGRVLPKSGEEVPVRSSFLIGSFSILLPCGLLYGVILALGAFQSPLLAWVSIFTFWLGTLPAMSFAPELLKKIVRPLYKKLPLVTSSFLIVIGLVTIFNRVYMAYHTTHSCH